jgi:hypothetical protein
MAATKISNVVVPDVFNPYVVEKTAELANFYMGGIISNDAQLNALASQGGKLINMPFWKDLSGDDEVLSDSGALTVNAVTSGKDVAALLMRGKAWGVNDLATALSGDRDIMGKVGTLVADYWARSYQKVLVSSLDGVVADNIAANSGDMVVNVALETTVGAVKFDGDLFVDGQATFGDALGLISGIAMHSDTYNYLNKTDNISFEKESMGALEITTYRGLRVIVDDKLPKVAGTTSGFKYTTYLFGNGAFGLGIGNAPVPTETDRDSLAGEDILITRSHFVMHPRGIAFSNGSVAGASPTNAELKLATNWNRVYERRNVRIAAVIHN